MIINGVYFALLSGNLLLIAAALIVGPRLARLCRAAVLVNAVALAAMGIPLAFLLTSSHPSPESHSAIRILAGFTAPLLVEFTALVAIVRWRTRRP